VIVGIGTDVADVSRLAALMHGGRADVLAAFLTPAELAACRASPRGPTAAAVRFAAKEACAKALGTGVLGTMSWHDMELHAGSDGAALRLTGRAQQVAAARGVRAIHLSVTETTDVAAAVVVLDG
jgi:holo-[acyl-carrier protein] synthase